MKVTVERTPESEAVLNVELDWSELEKASERAYRKLAQQYNIPGFRKGHAPRSLLERRLGKETIYQEGLEDLIDESYRTAVRENNLRPIGQPKVDAPSLEIGEPYTFTARVPVLAPVTLGDFHAISVTPPSTEVSDVDVDQVLERVRQDQATWLPTERGAELGDQVTADMKVTVGDKTVSDLHDNEFVLAEERPGIFAGMDQQVLGMKEGEHKEFTTTIPDDYANTELAGKEAQFDVTIKAVKYRDLPELDDELAKSLGDFSTMDEVREAVRAQLTSQKETDARNTVRDEALAQAAAQADVTIHPVLVQEETDAMIQETRRMLEQNRLNLETYLAASNKSIDEYRTELEPQARERVKRDLVLNAIADAEGMTASDQEMEGWLAALSALGGQPMRLRQLSPGQRANVEGRIRREKALAHLVDVATQNSRTSGEAATPDAQPTSTAPTTPAVRDDEPNAAAVADAGQAAESVRNAQAAARATEPTEQPDEQDAAENATTTEVP